MGDLYPYSTDHRLVHVAMAETDAQLLHLEWSDGHRQTLHAIWLREQCACVQCRHPASLERILDQTGYSLDITPSHWSILENGDLRLTWPSDGPGGGHVSLYQAAWLRHGGRPPLDVPSPMTWGAALAEGLPRFDFGSVMAREDALLEWLETLRQTGLTYVENAPAAEGIVANLARRIGTLRETNFGGLFEVVAVPGAISNAYTAEELPLHVDLPAREYQPGFQFLHCLANETQGGNSLYCDGLAVAEKLRTEDAAAFRALTETPIIFRYHDEDTDYQMRAPLIGLEQDGTVREIRFNPAIMTVADCPAAAYREFQRAYRCFLTLTRDPGLRLERRMTAGEIAVFDNRRVLHGRRAFTAGGGRRHLQGAYVELEDVNSKIRVLRRHLR